MELRTMSGQSSKITETTTLHRELAVLLVTILSASAGCSSHVHKTFDVSQLPEIELKVGVVEVTPTTGVWESPALSPNGRRLVVQNEVYTDPVLPYEVCNICLFQRDNRGEWRPLPDIACGHYRKWGGMMVLPVQPSFDHTGSGVIITQITFDSLLSIPMLHTVHSWVERRFIETPDVERLVECRDWGLNKTELLQHARLSPDGRWLAFYTREHQNDKGIYLLDTKTGKKRRLSCELDKHPTWSADGSRIYFHTQYGGRRRRFEIESDDVERSVIGYFQLHMQDGELIAYERISMDDLNNEYIYNKHPVEVPGTSLLFFHGQEKPGGKKRLMVRLNEPKSQVFVVKPFLNGCKLKAAKHPCASRQQKDLVFVAKQSGETDYCHLVSLTLDALNKVEQAVVESGRGLSSHGVKQ